MSNLFKLSFTDAKMCWSRGQSWARKSPSEGPVHLAGEPMTIDIAEIVRPRYNRQPTIFPNCEEHLYNSS